MNILLEKVNTLKDEQEKVQKKTFTKWINSHLCHMKPPVIVKDLMVELRDGVLLLNLLEILTDTHFKKEQPKNMQRIHCITNVKAALNFLENERKIKLVNINPADVVDGKPAIVLGLVWTLILDLQIEEQEDVLLKALGLENDPKNKGKGQAKKGLLAWSNQTLSDKYGLNIKDFGESWCDGKAFNALVHNIDPSLIDMNAIDNQTNKERLENAFNVAEQGLGIPKLLDVEDVDVEKPDERSIMTYVAQFLKSYPDGKRTDDADDDIKAELGNNQMAVPLKDLDKVKEFNENVNQSFANPNNKDNFEIFENFLNQKDDIQNTLNHLLTENNPDTDENELKKANEEFQRTDMKLKEWQWNLDKKLPGKLGSEIGSWLQKAEECLMEPFPDFKDEAFNENVLKKLKEHETIFKDKNDILKKFNEIKKNPPPNVSKNQLDIMEKRLLEVIRNEPKAKEKLNIFALQAQLKNKSDKWNKDLDSWNSPLRSKDDVSDRKEKFSESTDNGTLIDEYSNQLHELIKRKIEFCKDNPDVDNELLDFLNESIIKCEEVNDELPEKFDETRNKLENLSNALNEVNDAEENIDTFLQKLNNALKTNDVREQKLLSEQLPEIMELLNDVQEKTEREVIPFCSPELSNAIKKKLNNFDDKIKSMGEEVIDRIEKQEQEEAKQQQAAQDLMIEALISDTKTDTEQIKDWLKDFDQCIGSSINGTSEDLQNSLKTLEDLNNNAPEIQNLINQGYQAVTELRRLNSPEKAAELKHMMDELQNKFLNYKEKEIPKNLNSLKEMIDTSKAMEKGLVELEKYNKEGKQVADSIENPRASNISPSKKQEFIGKKKDIMNSIEEDKNLLKKLKDLSQKTNMKIDLKPLENKIAASENSLKDLLQKAEENIKAANQCEEVCKKASQCLNNLSNNINNEKSDKKDEEGQKEKMKDLETMEKDLTKAEDLIKEAVNQRNQAAPKLAKSELEKIDEDIAHMKKNANDLKNQMQSKKAKLKDNLNNWQEFDKMKDSISNDLQKTIDELDKSHKKRKGLHGEDCKDKANLLQENKARLEDLKNQEEEIKDLIEVAKKLGSAKPVTEAEELLKKHRKQKEDLEKEIKQNETDLQNHQQLEKQIDSFKNWLQESEKLNDLIENLPNTKQGLLEKQKHLQKLNDLKVQGDQMLRDLKNQQNVVLNQTSVDHTDHINADIKNEVDKYNQIFGNLGQQNDVNETIEKLEDIGQKSDQISDMIDDINNKIDQCLHLPNDSINEKEKVGKDLKNLSRLLDQQKSQIQNLKKQFQSLENCEAVEELLTKLEALEEQCEECKSTVNEQMSQNENEIKQQAALEKQLNEFADLMNETEKEFGRCTPVENSEEAIEESLKKLTKLKTKHNPGKEILEGIIKAQQVFNAPKQCLEACENSEEKYLSLEDGIKKLEEKLELKKNSWSDFNSLKDGVKNDLDSISKQIEDCHRKHKGVHGKDFDDKAALLKENEKRLADLKNSEKQINNLLNMAKKLGSDNAMDDIENLKDAFSKQEEDLREEIQQNKKDLEDHEQLEKCLESFKDFLKNSEKEATTMGNLPNNKAGLKEKQIKLEELNKLKLHGGDILKDLKILQNIVLNETSIDGKNELNAEINREYDRFNKLFGNLDQDQDHIKETIENLKKIEERSNDIQKTIEEVDEKFEKCISLPMESVNDKEKFGKELKNLDQILDQDKFQIDNLKNQCENLDQNAAVLDLVGKLKDLERKCDSIKSEIKQQGSKNNDSIKNQMAFEDKLQDFETLMDQLTNEMDHCLPKEYNEVSIAESLKKLEKIKSRHKQGKGILNDLQKSSNLLSDSQNVSEAFENSEQKFSDVEDEIMQLENQLEMQKNNWSQFNTEKEGLEEWLKSISAEMEKLYKKNDGIHAGQISDKEQLLEDNRALLQDVLNREADIRLFIDMSNPLSTGTNQDSTKRMTNSICKKYEKLLEDLSNKVKQNEEDLTEHENYKASCDNFRDENNSILKSFNEKLATLPNTKEGLKQKLDLYGKLKDTYNERKVLLVNLEKEKNNVIDHTSPKYYRELDQQWDEIVDNFEKYFNITNENQSKLSLAVQQIEKTESAYDDLSKNLENINKNINSTLLHPISSIDDIETKLQSLKDLQYELKELEGPLNELNRKSTANTHDIMKEKVEQLSNQYKQVKENLSSNLIECENQHRQQSNITTSLANFRTWLDYITNQIDDRSKPTNLELKNLKTNLNSLKVLRDDMAEHKVDLSRLQNSIDAFMKISKDNSLQDSLNELTERYNDIYSQCQNESEKCDFLIALMNKFESSRSKVLHWIESNTQVLLSCSDYTLKPSQMKSKLSIIESLEKDMENNGKTKLIEAVQDGEELMKELSDMPLDLVAQQVGELKSNWTEMSRQLNQLLNNLKNSTDRSEAFKEMSSRLSSWLDDVEHTGLMDSMSIDHHCEIPADESCSSNKSERIKILLMELNRRKPDFIQLSNMASDLSNPSFDIENSQIQNRFNRLQVNLKDKIEKLNRQQADCEKVKQDIEELEKWIFQTSMQMINDNADEGSSMNTSVHEVNELINHSSEMIDLILAKEVELSKIRQSVDFIINGTESQIDERSKDLQDDFIKLNENFNNLKETSIHKRDHLIDSAKKWGNFQNFLETTKSFLDNEMPKWWKDKTQATMKPIFSSKDNDNIYKDILEMENKLNGFKKNMENEAKECDGIVPTVANSLSRSQTPNFRNNRPSSSASTSRWIRDSHCSDGNEGFDPRLSQTIFKELEENIKKLSDFKKSHQEKTSDWNNFNREKMSLKNWLDNELLKLTNTLHSTPGISNVESFQRNKLKNIQDEMNNKKPILSTLNDRFADLTSQIPGATDPVLKDLNKDFEVAMKEINKLLNRVDKEVEANFTDEDSNFEIIQEKLIPKLNLESLGTQYNNGYESPGNLHRCTQTNHSKDITDRKQQSTLNSSSQTPMSKTTQTHFHEKANYGLQTSNMPCCKKHMRKEMCKNICSTIRGINDRLQWPKADLEYRSPHSLMSPKHRTEIQESVRRNVSSSSNRNLITPRYDYDSHSYRSKSARPGRNSSQQEYLSQIPKNFKDIFDDLDYYVPKHKSFSPSFSSQTFLDVPHYPSKEFQVDYNSTMDNHTRRSSASRRNGRKSSRSRMKSRINDTSLNSKHPRMKESLNQIDRVAEDLRNLQKEMEYD